MTSSLDRLRRCVAKCGVASLLAGWMLLAVDCETVFPRQSWNREWGSMVPHKSFPGDCGTCHYPDRWDTIRESFQFDHEKETGHPLRGAHGQAACLRCHNDRGPVLVYVQRGCGGCHVDPHQGSLGIECTKCHNEDHWQAIGLIADHARTRFPLSGAHAISPCEDCHERASVGEYRGAPVECHFCHQQEAAHAVPNHVINGWQRDCTRCHDLVSWQQAPGFNHDFFPLEGAHAALNCTQCHPGGRFVPIPNTCYSCHRQDYLAAPNHVAGGYSTDCASCHNTTAWR